MFKRHFYTKNLSAEKRIGAHNKDVISVLVGNLLGDGYGEKRNNSTRFQIHIQSLNAEYVFWLHKFFALKGYCSPIKPHIKKKIGKKNKIYFSMTFKTFSFSSLNFLYDSFYKENKQTKKKSKCVPTNIDCLLTEQALAIWVMDSGGKGGSGFKISTESFCHKDNLLLQKALHKNFSIEPSIQRHKNKYLLYFKKSDIHSVWSVVKTYTLSLMYYKFKI